MGKLKSCAKRYIIATVASALVAGGTAGVTLYKNIVEKAGDTVNNAVSTAASTFSKNGAVNQTSSMKKTPYKVKRVVDGDTIIIPYKGKNTYVRMIGVDTPESVHQNKKKNTVWGKKASKYTKSKLNNKKVYLEFDKEKKDCNGRLLAYVYTKDSKGDYIMYNKTLVKKGYARAVYYAPNGKYKAVLEKLQRQAKKSKRGFWKAGYTKAFPNT